MSIMEEIYNGKVYPSEQVVPEKGGEYWKMHQRADKLLSEFENQLSKEEYAKLNEICDCMIDCQDIMCLEFYRLGFSMGLLLMKEAEENPYLPKEEE